MSLHSIQQALSESVYITDHQNFTGTVEFYASHCQRDCVQFHTNNLILQFQVPPSIQHLQLRHDLGG
jgi:hypothetical protein